MLAYAGVAAPSATLHYFFSEARMNKARSSGTLEASSDRYSTHEVVNQAKPASGFNAFTADVVLRAAIDREAPWAADRCEALGAVAGNEDVQELARLANRHLPELETHDRFGNRVDWAKSRHDCLGVHDTN